MRRKTPRPNNPYRVFFKKYADTQMTYEELIAEFKGYKIYGFLDNADIHIVDENNESVLFFESIGYDDDDCVPTIYEASAIFLGQPFDKVAWGYADINEMPKFLNEGAN